MLDYWKKELAKREADGSSDWKIKLVKNQIKGLEQG
tara:strand:- start:320 stop:427 length:108 start_codon:yes stop_codon:yes gene_type:complete